MGSQLGTFKKARVREFQESDENFESHPCSHVARERRIPPGDVASN